MFPFFETRQEDKMSSRTPESKPARGDGPRAGELYEMPGHLIRRMHQASMAIFDTQIAAAGFDLTSVQFAALTMIASTPGLDQATLATAIAFDRATTGGVIDRLEAKCLVRREIAKCDRRSRRLYLEPQGTVVLARVTPVVKRAQALMLQGLDSQERVMLLQLLSKALAAVGDASCTAGKPIPGMAARSWGSSS